MQRSSRFQFHAGSIKGPPTATTMSPTPTWFQFHAGSIKGVYHVHELCAGRHGFQFHAGSIKGRVPARNAALRLQRFQFHAGSIKGLLALLALLTSQYSFNSTLVRLKARACRSAGRPCPNTPFQFHAGSIKGSYPAASGVSASKLFQFHAGSIKGHCNGSVKPCQVFWVSIPRWFD